MSKTDLKAAMESLQVKKPLRLPASAPSFKAPPPPASQLPPVSQDAKSPQEQIGTKDKSKSKVGAITTDTAEPQGEIPSRIPAGVLDLTASEDAESPKVDTHQTVPRITQPRLATEQDRAVTEAASVKDRLSTGYTRVPNKLLMEMVAGRLSRNEMKILLLIARMTISFNRQYVPLSKGIISRMTGIQGRAVLEAMQSLETANLIVKIPGNFKSPNRLGLVLDTGFIDGGSKGSKPPQDHSQPKDTNSSEDGLNSSTLDSTSTYKKDNPENINLRNSLSLENLSEPLRKYFCELKPRRKREAEFLAFQELIGDFTEDQILACLHYLQTRGVPGSSDACHSPMAYLTKAITQVLAEATRVQKQESHTQKFAEILSTDTRKKQEEELRDEREKELRIKAFLEAYPTSAEQEQVISKYSKDFPMLRKDGAVMRALVIDRWWLLNRQY